MNTKPHIKVLCASLVVFGLSALVMLAPVFDRPTSGNSSSSASSGIVTNGGTGINNTFSNANFAGIVTFDNGSGNQYERQEVNHTTNTYFAVQQGKFVIEPLYGFEVRGSSVVGTTSTSSNGYSSDGVIFTLMPSNAPASGDVVQYNGTSGATKAVSLVSSSRHSITNVTAAFTAVTNFNFVLANTVFSNLTITLPASAEDGWMCVVKNIGTNQLTIAANAGQAIETVASLSVPAQFSARSVVKVSTNWWVY